MKTEAKLLEELKLKISKIDYLKTLKVLTTDQGTYTLKVKKNNTAETYNYLNSRNFSNYLSPIPLKNNQYEMYPYLIERKMPASDKAIDLVYTMALLHNKTTSYENTDLDKIKEIYENETARIAELKNYYLDLQDYIENKVFMSPADYLLIRNISSVYFALDNAKRSLDNWYSLHKNEKRERHVLLHNNISLEHFLISDDSFLSNWNNAKKGLVVYDFLNFFHNDYDNLEMKSLFELYQSKYQYTPSEKLLFESLILIPPKLKFKKDNLVNTIITRKFVNYVLKSLSFVLKDNEEDQKAQ